MTRRQRIDFERVQIGLYSVWRGETKLGLLVSSTSEANGKTLLWRFRDLNSANVRGEIVGGSFNEARRKIRERFER